MSRSSIYALLVIVSALVSAGWWIVAIYWKLNNISPSWSAILALLLVCWPAHIHFTSYCLWHWRSRYTGRNPTGWVIFFVLWVVVLPCFIYFMFHVLPDILGWRPHSPLEGAQQSRSSYRSSHEVIRSTLFVLGWSALAFVFLVCTLQFVALRALINVCELGIRSAVPQRYSKETAEIILEGVDAFKLGIWINAGCCILSVMGGVSLFISQRLKWREKI